MTRKPITNTQAFWIGLTLLVLATFPTAALDGFIRLFAAPAAAQNTQVREATNYVKDGSPYLGYVQLLECTGEGLTFGKECGGRLYVDPAAWPNNTVISWEVPFRAAKSGKPWGYPALSRGRPSNGVPRSIDAAKKLTEYSDIEIAVNAELVLTGDASVLSDTFLYATATDLTAKGRVGEIGVFLHASAAAKTWATPLPCIRSCTLIDRAGRKWSAKRSGVYYVFIPDGPDVLTGTINLKDFADFLQGAGLVSGEAVYPGTALGVEPAQGAGMLRLNSFAVTSR